MGYRNDNRRNDNDYISVKVLKGDLKYRNMLNQVCRKENRNFSDVIDQAIREYINKTLQSYSTVELMYLLGFEFEEVSNNADSSREE